MKKLIGGIPFLLVVGLIPYIAITNPNLAQAIIVTAITALAGYRYYLMNIERPDYVKLFEKELVSIRRENKEFREKYGKMSFDRASGGQSKDNFKW